MSAELPLSKEFKEGPASQEEAGREAAFGARHAGNACGPRSPRPEDVSASASHREGPRQPGCAWPGQVRTIRPLVRCLRRGAEPNHAPGRKTAGTSVSGNANPPSTTPQTWTILGASLRPVTIPPRGPQSLKCGQRSRSQRRKSDQESSSRGEYEVSLGGHAVGGPISRLEGAPRSQIWDDWSRKIKNRNNGLWPVAKK